MASPSAPRGVLEAAYRRRTPGSARAFARSRRLHVNGVHHNIRYFDPYPFVARSARGSVLTDVDSNRYTDYWMGHWSLILGHARREVRDAVAAQLGRGWMHGTASEPALELSEAIAGAVGAAERIRYVTSGAEAVSYAVRLARAHTGRRLVAKVDGGWHGYASELLSSVNWPFRAPESAGMAGAGGVVSVPYNDVERTLSVLRRAGRRLACVVLEPLLGGGGCVPAERGYLEAVQDFARSRGALLVLDEIVTGFRFRYGCLYREMRLDPDLVTLGKVAGGGMPVGAICGREGIMERANTSSRGAAERAYIGGGTFSANPATMSAGAAALRVLRRDGRAIYGRIGRLGEEARRGVAAALGGAASVTGAGSLFMPHFGRGGASPEVRDAAAAARCDTAELARYHFKMIAEDGIFFLPGKLGAISAAHTRADVRRLVGAAGDYAARFLA